MMLTATAIAGILMGTASFAVAQTPCLASCNGDLCTFNVKVNLFAGELGYFTFDECGDAISPTLGLEIGKTYHFNQSDRTNYYHPLGFAYFPDGDHAGKDELEPVIAPPDSGSNCSATATCPAPMYFQAGQYLGTYSNLPAGILPGTDQDITISSGEVNFGLDDYEPKFFYPIPDWLSFGAFGVYLRFTEKNYKSDIFYFCHIHQFMSGRIKLINTDGELVNSEDTPPLGYEYDTLSEFDKECGTFNLTGFQLPNAECPDRFICNVREDRAELRQLSKCIDAMNCHMMASMTTDAVSEIALFIHQMIPHHQNAVNMAKAVLKIGIDCPDLSDEEDPACIMERILRDIVNSQNAQIQSMRGVLEAIGSEEFADCPVKIFGESDLTAMDGDAPVMSPVQAPTTSGSGRIVLNIAMTALSVLCVVMEL